MKSSFFQRRVVCLPADDAQKRHARTVAGTIEFLRNDTCSFMASLPEFYARRSAVNAIATQNVALPSGLRRFGASVQLIWSVDVSFKNDSELTDRRRCGMPGGASDWFVRPICAAKARLFARRAAGAVAILFSVSRTGRSGAPGRLAARRAGGSGSPTSNRQPCRRAG